PRAVVADHLGGADGAHRQAVLEAFAARVAGKEARGEQVARARRVDHFGDRLGRDLRTLAVRHRDRAVRATRGDEDRDFPGHCGDAGFEVVLAGQRGQLVLVDEQDVDLALVDQRAEIVAVALYDEAFAGGEGDLAAGTAGDLDRPPHRAARLLGIP